jgi:hypothetical protein
MLSRMTEQGSAHVLDREAEVGHDALQGRAAVKDGVVDRGRVGLVGVRAGPVRGGDPARRWFPREGFTGDSD